MLNKRPNAALGVLFHADRVFVVQKTGYGPNGRPRTTSDTRFRVFEISERLPEKVYLNVTWIGSVPTMRSVKALISNHVDKGVSL